MSTSVLLIIGSTRPVRIGPQLAASITRAWQERDDIEVKTVDLVDLALPLLDEPMPPARGDYRNPHTLAWAEQVATADVVIVLTPQYNFAYPASVKNAIDYLYAEWAGKPVGIVSYGARGGNQAYNALHQVLMFVGAQLASNGVHITAPHEAFGDDGRLADAPSVVAPYLAQLDALVDDLVELAAADAGERRFPSVPLDVEELVAVLASAVNDRDEAAVTALGEPASALAAVTVGDKERVGTPAIRMLTADTAIAELPVSGGARERRIVAVLVKDRFQWHVAELVYGAAVRERDAEAA